MPFQTAPSPHLQEKSSAFQTMWTIVAALLPVLLVSIFTSKGQVLRLLIATLAGSIVAEWGMRRIFKKPLTFYDGSTTINAILLALLLPWDLAFWIVFLGAAFGTAVAKEAFGGFGQNLFHPSLVGNAFLLLTFPFFMDSFSDPSGFVTILSILIGGLILIFAGIISWDLPLLYILGVVIFSLLLGEGRTTIHGTEHHLFLAAFFIVTDSVTNPLTRSGKRWFAMGGAFFTSLFHRWATYPCEGLTYGILLMNALVPQLDDWLRPARAKKVLAR